MPVQVLDPPLPNHNVEVKLFNLKKSQFFLVENETGNNKLMEIFPVVLRTGPMAFVLSCFPVPLFSKTRCC